MRKSASRAPMTAATVVRSGTPERPTWSCSASCGCGRLAYTNASRSCSWFMQLCSSSAWRAPCAMAKITFAYEFTASSRAAMADGHAPLWSSSSQAEQLCSRLLRMTRQVCHSDAHQAEAALQVGLLLRVQRECLPASGVINAVPYAAHVGLQLLPSHPQPPLHQATSRGLALFLHGSFTPACDIAMLL